MYELDWDDFASLLFGVAVFVLLVGSYWIGLFLRRFLPPKHQTHESLEIVHAVIGMLVAMIAILLGLQLDSTTKSFDGLEQLVDRYGVQIVQLDASLRDYGAAADSVRQQLRIYTASATAALQQGESGDHKEQGRLLQSVNLKVLELIPTNAMQSRIQSDSLSLISQLFQERWQLIAGGRLLQNIPLYAVLLFWLTLVYVAFGLNAVFNVPVFCVLFLSAIAIGAAVFVLSDMATPFSGLISISPHRMQEALERLNE